MSEIKQSLLFTLPNGLNTRQCMPVWRSRQPAHILSMERRGRPIQEILARSAIVAEMVRLGGKQLREIAPERDEVRQGRKMQ